MNLTMRQVATITKGELLQGDDSAVIDHLVLDSRKALQAEHSLFIAIHGVRHNSHLVLADLFLKGMRCFLVEEDISMEGLGGATIVRVPHSITAMQLLAAHQRAQCRYPVVGITGSNGKTIVKEWLNVMLSDDYRIVRSPKSYNSQIGVPISVWNMNDSHQLGLFEAGISEPGEMEKLAKVIQPTIGILTTIGTAHMENFLSRRQLIGEKLHLFARAETILVPDDADVLQLVSPWSETKNIIVIPEVRLLQSSHADNHHRIQLGQEDFLFEVSFDDKASIENIACCIVFMRHLGYSNALIQDRLKRLTALEMRLQLLEGENGAVIVNDAYSNDLQSLEIALDFLSRHARGKEKVVILSDFIQSGMKIDELDRSVVNMLKRHAISEWVSIGPSGKAQQPEFGERYRHYGNTSDFLTDLDGDAFHQKAILIKGARTFAFERIVSAFQEQSHDSVLQIDLGALVHNLNFFKSKIQPTTKLMVMVKAFGYGIGAPQVASILMFNKADYLAVAYTDEGVALRKSGISLPIMVMNPERNSLSALIKFKLEPEIYSLRTLHLFLKALQQSPSHTPYPIHLKLDTGMHRLGFEAHQLDDLIGELKRTPQLRVASIFTHLAATDNPQLDDFTRGQLALFNQHVQRILPHLDHRPLLHALNTGGIQRFPEAQYDMVRLGVGLYGVSADSNEQSHLLPVNTLKTVISQIKDVKAGDSIGYNRAFIAPQNMRSATIPLGYADGLRRQLSNGVGHVVINGQRAPIVGNVCMDMTMVDVTAIDCQEGDAVEVFGQQQSIGEFAKSSGTIAYEILTSISQRVKRIYIQD